MSSPEPEPSSGFRTWSCASPAEQDACWADPTAAGTLRRALWHTILGRWQESLGDAAALEGLIEQLNWLQVAPSMPGSWVFPWLTRWLNPATTVPARAEQIIAQHHADPPLPLDMEGEELGRRLAAREPGPLLSLLLSMAEDEPARELVVAGIGLTVAADGEGGGLRCRLAAAWAVQAPTLDAADFAASAWLLARSHWSLPASCAVVVPESLSPGRESEEKPLLVSLRERDLPAYMQHLRAMGDQPLAALRQLFLSTGLAVLECAEDARRRDLARLYLWMGSSLQLPHRSRHQSRRLLFSVAAALFRQAGWQSVPTAPSVRELQSYGEAVRAGRAAAPTNPWQSCIAATLDGQPEHAADWWRAAALRYVGDTAEERPYFFALWHTAKTADSLVGGPLAWIHPLVFQALNRI